MYGPTHPASKLSVFAARLGKNFMEKKKTRKPINMLVSGVRFVKYILDNFEPVLTLYLLIYINT